MKEIQDTVKALRKQMEDIEKKDKEDEKKELNKDDDDDGDDDDKAQQAHALVQTLEGSKSPYMSITA